MIVSHTVGTAVVQVLQPVSNRDNFKFIAIGNSGSGLAYLKLVPDTATLTVANGIPLPSGTSIVCNDDAKRDLFDAGAYAVASGGTTTISVQAF